MTVTYPIIALGDGEVSDPQWFADVTEAVNDHETRLGVVEESLIQLVYKTADETIQSDTTLSNDSQLFLGVEANASYVFDSVIFFNTGGTPDYKGQWSAPSGATLTFQCTGYSISDVLGVFWNSVGSLQTIAGNGTPRAHSMSGTLIVGSTAGTLRWQWAQNTSTASNTSTLIGSYIRLVKVVT